MPKAETYKYGTNGAVIYAGICRDSTVEMDSQRNNPGERAKFG